MNEVERIRKYLEDNELFFNDVFEGNFGLINIDIHWGDWKHEHLYCDDLMEELGYDLVYEEVTEENGSDSYSAIRTYNKKL